MTIAEYTTNAANRFLRNVIFVDDKLFEETGSSPGTSAGPLVAPTKRVQVPGSNAPKVLVDVVIDETEELPNTLDFGKISQSFAKKGVLCALHKPESREDLFSDDGIAASLCQKADICILDWDFNGDNGESIKALITNIVRKDRGAFPSTPRLVFLYTSKANLVAIADVVLQAVEAITGTSWSMPAATLPDQGPQYIEAPNGLTRIVPLAKMASRASAASKAYEVSESDLPERVIREFASFVSGFTQATVLNHISAIRENTARILGRFTKDIDVPYSVHSELVRVTGDDASEGLVDVSLGEFRAVLEDDTNGTGLQELVEECLAAVEIGQQETTALGKALLKIYKDDKKMPESQRLDDVFTKAVKLLCRDEHVRNLNHFGSLLSGRAIYAGRGYYLRLGTILRDDVVEGQPSKFWICLQPLCDSVRLNEKTGFVLHELEEEVSGKIAVEYNGNWHNLVFKASTKELRSATFEPESSSGTIEPSYVDGVRTFTTVEGRIFIWYGQLRSELGQRVAQEFSSLIARVGLNESEIHRIREHKKV